MRPAEFYLEVGARLRDFQPDLDGTARLIGRFALLGEVHWWWRSGSRGLEHLPDDFTAYWVKWSDLDPC